MFKGTALLGGYIFSDNDDLNIVAFKRMQIPRHIRADFKPLKARKRGCVVKRGKMPVGGYVYGDRDENGNWSSIIEGGVRPALWLSLE
jgi:hypothetical protein